MRNDRENLEPENGGMCSIYYQKNGTPQYLLRLDLCPLGKQLGATPVHLAMQDESSTGLNRLEEIVQLSALVERGCD
jgi:hypothetical protein